MTYIRERVICAIVKELANMVRLQNYVSRIRFVCYCFEKHLDVSRESHLGTIFKRINKDIF